MEPGRLIRVGNSYGEELSYLVRTKLGNLQSEDFMVSSGDLGILISEPVTHREGWPQFVRVVFSSGRIGYISASLVEIL